MAAIETRTHTALHLLKGAASKVLGAKWTASTSVRGSHGRIAIQLSYEPADEEITRVEEEANAKIREGAEIEELYLPRSEAERRWGDLIYDLFPLPPSVTDLSILNIPNWNVNACNQRHTKTTSEIGLLRIANVRYRPSRHLLEISFDISN